MKNPLFLLLFCFIAAILPAQPGIQWKRTLGGTSVESNPYVRQTNDGGYIVAGTTLSVNGDVSNTYGGADVWIVKLGATGGVEWQKTFGGNDADEAYAIRQTNDGGYIVAGSSISNDGDVSGNHGNFDFWVLKISAVGIIQWQKSLGGDWIDVASAIQQTSDGGYILAGQTGSNNGDVTGNHGGDDVWVVKLSDAGDLQWQKALGGSHRDRAFSLDQTGDGGFILSGLTHSNDGDVSGHHGYDDMWVVKLSGSGGIEWQKALGGSAYEEAWSVRATNDGGYIVLGYSESTDGDVIGNHGADDFWVVKLSGAGEMQWQKSLGGSSPDYGYSIEQTSDGDYILAGRSSSNDGDVTGNHGQHDFWVLRIDSLGAIQWQQSFGGSNQDEAADIHQTLDGGYIISGQTMSNNGDVTGFHGGRDFWIIKLFPETVGVEEVSAASRAERLELYPNPSNQSVFLKIVSAESVMVVSIFDLLGEQIRRETIENGGELDISSLPNGLYLARATTGSGQVFTSKLLKED